jgi:DNA ligase-1
MWKQRRRALARLGLGLLLTGASSLSVAARRAEAGEGVAPDLLLAPHLEGLIDPSPYLVSEKMDGVRAFWDGKRLRFRSGREIPAPGWFVSRLPAVALDGELWLARGGFEALSGFVRTESPDDQAWRRLRYMLFELPGAAGPFEDRVARLHEIAQRTGWQQLQAVEQFRLASAGALQARLDEVTRAGGEGLMLHRADAPYVTGRSDVLLKLKPLQDAEAVVVEHLPGQGKYAGRMGGLRVRAADSRSFIIGTGFSDAQRESPPPVGSRVTYTHRGFTSNGLPRFASFLRVAADF